MATLKLDLIFFRVPRTLVSSTPDRRVGEYEDKDSAIKLSKFRREAGTKMIYEKHLRSSGLEEIYSHSAFGKIYNNLF